MELVEATLRDHAGIYEIRHAPSGRVYIGSTLRGFGSRRNMHTSELRRGRHRNPQMQSDWQRDGEAAFEFRPLAVFDRANAAVMLDCERRLIVQTIARGNAYNLAADASRTAFGRIRGPLSAETRRRASVARKGQKPSTATLDAARAAKRAKVYTLEECARISAALRGKPLKQPRSVEHNRKLGATRLKTYPGFIDPDGVEHRNIDNLPAFCAEHGLKYSTMWAIARGQNHPRSGWRAVPWN